MGDMVSELTVVVDEDFTREEILIGIDLAIGHHHNRHYPYGGRRDIVYYIPEADIERVGTVLEGIKAVFAYTFNDVKSVDEWSGRL